MLKKEVEFTIIYMSPIDSDLDVKLLFTGTPKIGVGKPIFYKVLRQETP